MNDDLIIYELLGSHGNIGIIMLDNPSNLNAVNLHHAKLIYKKLCLWDNDPNIKAIIIKSKHENFFCAGGDLKAIYENGKDYTYAKFWHEYRLVEKISSLTKPYIALINGITMGGGVGISINGKYRIGAPNLRFAMPESCIGFIPDVGASYFLTKAPGRIGKYLGITGNVIDADSTLFAGFIDYIVPYHNFDKLINEISKTNLTTEPEKNLESIFQEYAIGTKESEIKKDFDLINKTFNHSTLDELWSNLKKAPLEWQQTINNNSPNSIRITDRLLSEGNCQNLKQALKQEFQIACNIYIGNDFREGIRAKLIAKDNSPNWQDHKLNNIEFFLKKNNVELEFNSQDKF